MSRRNQVVVPQCKAALNAMKYELAAEIGLYTPGQEDFSAEFAGELGTSGPTTSSSINWREAATRDVGYIGGSITKRLIQQAEQVLGQL